MEEDKQAAAAATAGALLRRWWPVRELLLPTAVKEDVTVVVELRPLPSYEDENYAIFCLGSGDGAERRPGPSSTAALAVLKLAPERRTAAGELELELQGDVLAHLRATGLSGNVPEPLRPHPWQNSDGARWSVPVSCEESSTTVPQARRRARCVRYVAGRVLGEIGWRGASLPAAVLSALGSTLADMAVALQSFPRAAERGLRPADFAWDLQNASRVAESWRTDLNSNCNASGAAASKAVEMELRLLTVFELFESSVLPHAASLPCGLIHGDANDMNIVVLSQQTVADASSSGQVALIDLGDMCYSWLVNDLAICLAYMLLLCEPPSVDGADAAVTATATSSPASTSSSDANESDRLTVARRVLSTVREAYERCRPLSTTERRVLEPLLWTRLACSLVMSTRNAVMAPSNAYTQISSAPARAWLRWYHHRSGSGLLCD